MSSVHIHRRRLFFADPIFAANWKDFERIGEALREEPGDAKKRLAEDLRRQPCFDALEAKLTK